MSSRLKTSLYRTLLAASVCNILFTVVFAVCVFYYRRRISVYQDSISRLASYNSVLSFDLQRANYVLTNYYFNAASSFASNVLITASSNSTVFAAQSSAFVSPSLPPDEKKETPPLSFRRYFEVDGNAFICVRDKIYGVGDLLLGYPVEGISPDVVQYRGIFYKVDP